ncbi:MAG: zinc ribbon domain-containing protein [Phycisphaerales bacterium]
MPLIEYKCESCGKVNEFLEKSLNSKQSHTCPSCGGKKLTKQFSTFSAVIKNPADGKTCHTCPSHGTCPHSGH